MSPEHLYNPFNSPEFREEMSKMFDEKLKGFAELKQTVEEHEEYIQQQKGGGRVLHYLWTAAVAGLSGFLGGKYHG